MAPTPSLQRLEETVIVRPEFWRDKRVLVTGHTGFKGSWLCAWLQRMGAQISGFAHPASTKPSLFLTARIGGGMRSFEADVRDLDSLHRALRDAQPEIVLHLAAQPIVRRSYVDPVGTFSTNVLGTVNLLEAVRLTDCARAVIVVTSDKCYENREWLWSYREKSTLGGRDPYSSSKACAELVTRAYRESFFAGDGRAHVATARAGNVVGGGDWAVDRLVPDTVSALVAGEPVELRYPNAIRPWQHVLDPLAGYLQLAERLLESGEPYAEGWNFAPREDDARSVGWVVERLQQAWGVGPAWKPQEGPKPHEHIYLKLDSSKARALLDWYPRLSIEDTVAWTVEWYRAFYDGTDARELVEGQIERFVHEAAPVSTPWRT